MKEANRRTAEQAKETIAGILLFDVSDPELAMVTITSCKVSFDRAYCDVFYTVDHSKYKQVEAALDRSKGYMRSQMAKKLSWKKVPELRFHLDETIDASERLTSMLKSEHDRMSFIETGQEDGGK